MLSSNSKEISAKLRKKGIFNENTKQAGLDQPVYQAERKCDADKLLCTGCCGFYSVNTFYKHKSVCKAESLPSGVQVSQTLKVIAVHSFILI